VHDPSVVDIDCFQPEYIVQYLCGRWKTDLSSGQVCCLLPNNYEHDLKQKSFLRWCNHKANDVYCNICYSWLQMMSTLLWGFVISPRSSCLRNCNINKNIKWGKNFYALITPWFTCFCLCFSEDRNALNKVTDAVRTNFNDRVDEVRIETSGVGWVIKPDSKYVSQGWDRIYECLIGNLLKSCLFKKVFLVDLKGLFSSQKNSLTIKKNLQKISLQLY